MRVRYANQRVMRCYFFHFYYQLKDLIEMEKL